jgi:zinc transporter ZupT
MASWLYPLILFLAAIAGGVIWVAIKPKSNGSTFKLTLSFSAAYLLGLALLHLFPDLFSSEMTHAGWLVLAGFMLQVVLDFFSHGVEHGHSHAHAHAKPGWFIPVMVSLWVHALIEGVPFASGTSHFHDERNPLLLGIAIHKITESFVFMALLIHSGMRFSRAFFWLVIFACMAPLGALIAPYVGSDTGPLFTALLLGIILHVSTTILFESEEGHRFNWMKFASILLGIAAAALLSAA